MKYLVIGHKFGALKRGGFVVSKRFCEEHPNDCKFIQDIKARGRSLNILNEKYRRLIFRTQVPRCYSIPINFVKLRKLNHIIYLRARYLSPLYNSCTNGFYYYKMHENIRHYIPMITNFPEITEQPKDVCLGFYVRKWLTPDSFNCFVDILDNMKEKYDLCIMGDQNDQLKNHPNIKSFKHTNDNYEFFSRITHYFYPTSGYFVDPFPHSVLEAVQTGKQIIFPKIDRPHKDGIDDIKDCIVWHKEFNQDIYLDNSNQPMTAENFRKFYQMIFDNNWEYDFNRDKYNRMIDWIVGEVL
ncbi:MAG: hypothetical protein KGD64_02030 [Candidatus Heimdallarchaeota archaeon]|nr:hypothetical protein [Candidatus Heimdallarchaeota archaeon]